MVAVAGRRPASASVGRPGGAGRALLPRSCASLDGPGQQGVALRVAGQHHQMAASTEPDSRGWPGPAEAGSAPRVGLARRQLGLGATQGELGPEDGGQAQRPGGLGEADHAVEAVVVGEGQGLEPQPGGLLDQLLGERGAVEEAEVGVAVQLGVGHRAGVRTTPAGAARTGPACATRPGCRRRRPRPGVAGAGRAGPVRQPALELGQETGGLNPESSGTRPRVANTCSIVRSESGASGPPLTMSSTYSGRGPARGTDTRRSAGTRRTKRSTDDHGGGHGRSRRGGRAPRTRWRRCSTG